MNSLLLFLKNNAFFMLYVFGIALTASCASMRPPDLPSPPEPMVTPVPAETAADTSPQTERYMTAAEMLQETRGLLEIGSPQSLRAALALIEGRGLSQSEYGRMMNAIAALIIDRIYSDAGITHGPVDSPLHLSFTRIISDVEKGVWTPPPADSSDYLSNVLPCVILMTNASADVNNAALPFLQKARRLNRKGVLAVYFSGLIYERMGRLFDARQLYDEAVTLSGAECYPAFLGIARILARSDKHNEAISLLLDLVRLYPDNLAARRQLANSYIGAGEWANADSVIAAVLSRDYRNPEFLLMQARVSIELGRYNQAQLPLDTYIPAGGNGTNRQYLFLRARLAWEGNRSRSTATAQLRAILAVTPDDSDTQIYLARLLLGATQAAFKMEGRQMLERLLSQPPLTQAVLQLALDDAISRQLWAEADAYLQEILKEEPPTLASLKNAVLVKTGLGDRAAALGFSRTAAAAFPADENTRMDLAGILVESSVQEERDEGGRMIDAVLPELKNASERSRAHYYRSRLRANDEDAINDLRSSLLEDPRNVNALLGLIAIYDKRKDTRRVTFYLQQALVLAPENTEVDRLRRIYQ
jgi:Tfp pilus assembly protein PilF